MIIIDTCLIVVEYFRTITCRYYSALCRFHTLSGHGPANAGVRDSVSLGIKSHHLSLRSSYLILFLLQILLKVLLKLGLAFLKLIRRPLGVIDLLHEVVVTVLFGQAHVCPFGCNDLAILPVLGQIGGQGRRQRSVGWHIRFPPLQ